MKHLIVAEAFYSLQCEGRAIGTPAVFLRLGGCNLMCDHKWRCDTIEVWQKSKAEPFEQVLPPEWITRLKEGAHLVITGGEPLLHQTSIVEYLSWLINKYQFTPFVEVETNGTILPLPHLDAFVDWYNVSPKLSNCGEPYERRVNEVAIMHFVKSGKAIFKFVLNNEHDLFEIFEDYNIPQNMCVLMPAGATQAELNVNRLQIAELAIRLGVRYSERLHIVIWNQKTGV